MIDELDQLLDKRVEQLKRKEQLNKLKMEEANVARSPQKSNVDEVCKVFPSKKEPVIFVTKSNNDETGPIGDKASDNLDKNQGEDLEDLPVGADKEVPSEKVESSVDSSLYESSEDESSDASRCEVRGIPEL